MQFEDVSKGWVKEGIIIMNGDLIFVVPTIFIKRPAP